MAFNITRQDITKMKVDVIVNAANTKLKMGGGVCGAIFAAAGAKELQEACDKLAPIKTGEAVITPGFKLPAKYVIHTAGPIYSEWTKEENEKHLSNSYINSMQLASDNKCKSIAFPLISSGIYGYPKEEALKIAIKSIQDFIAKNDIDVFLSLFDEELFHLASKLISG